MRPRRGHRSRARTQATVTGGSSGTAPGAPDAPTPDADRVLPGIIGRAGPWLAPLALLTALGAVAEVALPAVLGQAVDQLAAPPEGTTGGWAAARGSILTAVALVTCVVAVEAVTRLVVGLGTAQATAAVRGRLARHILAAGPRLARRTSEGDLVTRLVTSTRTAARAVTVVSGLAGALTVPIGGVVALALIDPWLALTFAVGMASLSGAVRLYLRDARTATAGYLEAQGAVAGRLVDALAGARTIAAARTTGREVDRVLGPLDGLRHHGHQVWATMARLAFRGEPVVLLTQVAVIVVAGLGVGAGRLTPGELLAASRYAVLAAGIGEILDELAGLARARAAAHRVGEILHEPPVAYGERTLPAGPGHLELRGVTAGPADAPVLHDLDLTVPGGRVTALVGRSGAGKSLTAALAGRLCDPAAGEVRLDGVALPLIDRPTLRRAVAYAFERPHLIGDTLEDAIAFGAGSPSPGEVRRAATAARADGFITRLPGGYRADAGATSMSGGELQRIGLARALAAGARLLILDDATSSLDTATEADIAAAVVGGPDGTAERTRLIVTHRAATAARADLVVWLDGGRVRALGPHRELWADPDYRDLFHSRDPVDVAAPPPAAATTRPEPAPGART